MTGSRKRRLLVACTLAVLAAIWTGSAGAVPPQRTVTFDSTSTFTSPFCGDAVIVEHDVGRLAVTLFFNPDGSLKDVHVNATAVTQTLTNTQTGATLTNFYSQLVDERASFDPNTGALTVTETVAGLNYIIRQPHGPPLVSAGRGVATYLITFDEQGNVISVTKVGETSTPNLFHLTQLLCA